MATEIAGEFEWDSAKARENVRKHGVTFMEAARVFLDPLAVDLPDATNPERLILLGMTIPEHLLYVVILSGPRPAGSALSAPGERRAMSKRITKTDEPTRASLDEMPEVDFSRLGKLSRGKYAERARRSLEVVVLDKKLVKVLGGPERVAGILHALAEAIGEKRHKKRRAA